MPEGYLPRRITDHVRRILLGPRRVDCYVSGRWLEFAEKGERIEPDGPRYVLVDVMTTTSGGERQWKICELVLGLDDLRKAIVEVERNSEDSQE